MWLKKEYREVSILRVGLKKLFKRVSGLAFSKKHAL